MAFFKYRHILAFLTLLTLAVGVTASLVNNNLFYLANIPATIIFFFFLYRQKTFIKAIVVKSIFDMAMNLSYLIVGTMDSLSSYINLYTSFLVYFILNLFVVQSKAYQYVILGYLFTPFLFSLAQSSLGKGKFYHLTFVSFVFAAVAYVIFEQKQKDDERKKKELSDLNAKYEELKNFNKVTKVREGIIIHDCKNILQSVLQIELEHSAKNCNDKVLDIAHGLRSKILEKLALLSDLSQTDFVLSEVMESVLAKAFPNLKCHKVRIPADCTMRFNLRFFESLVFNLGRNALEAYQSKFSDAAGFQFEVTLENSRIRFLDNAGGFDPSKIQFGRTSKAYGNGEFLATLLSNQGVLGLHVDIDAVGNGTRIEIGFDPNPFQASTPSPLRV